MSGLFNPSLGFLPQGLGNGTAPPPPPITGPTFGQVGSLVFGDMGQGIPTATNAGPTPGAYARTGGISASTFGAGGSPTFYWMVLDPGPTLAEMALVGLDSIAAAGGRTGLTLAVGQAGGNFPTSSAVQILDAYFGATNMLGSPPFRQFIGWQTRDGTQFMGVRRSSIGNMSLVYSLGAGEVSTFLASSGGSTNTYSGRTVIQWGAGSMTVTYWPNSDFTAPGNSLAFGVAGFTTVDKTGGVVCYTEREPPSLLAPTVRCGIGPIHWYTTYQPAPPFPNPWAPV